MAATLDESKKKTLWFRYLQYEEGRDTPSDARNVLLVILTLIAAVTFQAGVSPPGGVWQDSRDGHQAGNAIYASQTIPFYVFLIGNSIALFTSLFLLVSLTHHFHFRFEISIATLSMAITYGSAIFAVTPNELSKFRFILLSAAAPLVLRLCIHTFRFIRSN